VEGKAELIIELLFLAAVLIYVLKTLYDTNIRSQQEKISIPRIKTRTIPESKISEPEETPPAVAPETSLHLGETYRLEEKESKSGSEESQDISPPIVVTELIPEAENIDLDCFTYFKGARLLVVEDNIVNQKILLNILKQSGIEIDIAENGQVALGYLFKEHKEYDMVLMDISMPIMDGITTTKIIRRSSRFTGLPIVAFTAFSLGSEIKAMFEAGANAYLTKPLNINRLYTVFSLFIGNVNHGLSMEKMLEIQGLDTEKGLENAEENRVLYEEWLASFVERYSSSVELIPKWIEEKRYERIRLECKEMLPALNLIGAYEMQKMVQEIQLQFIYNNEHLLGKYALLYRAKMQALIDTIRVYLNQSKDDKS
jgi:CheY-like chemotaxis protein